MKLNTIKEYQLVQFIDYSHSPGDYATPHKHECYEIIFYSGGEGSISIEGEGIFYKNNSVCIVKPNCTHEEIAFTSTHVLCCIYQIPDYISLHSKIIYEDQKNKNVLRCLKLQMEELRDIAFSNGNDINMTEELMFNITILVLNLIENLQKKSQYYSNIVQYVQKHIKKNYAKAIDFDELSKNMGYSYNRFRHIFKKITGMGLKQYQVGIRINYAKNALLSSNEEISDIAKKCGYANYTRFLIAFEKGVGVPPSKFRSLVKDKKLMLMNFKQEKGF